MSLADRTPPQDGPAWQECGVAWLLRTLEHADADCLREWLAGGVPSAWIAHEITDETGLNADVNAIRRHRRGDCKC